MEKCHGKSWKKCMNSIHIFGSQKSLLWLEIFFFMAKNMGGKSWKKWKNAMTKVEKSLWFPPKFLVVKNPFCDLNFFFFHGQKLGGESWKKWKNAMTKVEKSPRFPPIFFVLENPFCSSKNFFYWLISLLIMRLDMLSLSPDASIIFTLK